MELMNMSESTQLVPITVTVNGKTYERKVEPRLLLVELIRETLGLTGTHIGCDTSYCGACTIIVDGDAIKSCTLLAVQADGSEILTVEGLERDGELHPLQQAFSQNHGLQCGFCTPGMLMSSLALLAENPDPDIKDIRKRLGGNLCRCTGYQNIIKSVQAAAKSLRED
jgi:carbon-monoxide dehydrogenase small subunit